MSAIPPNRQIASAQVPGAPAWFNAFLTALNGILGPLYDIANAGTTFGDNVPGQYKTITVNGPVTTPQMFNHSLRSPPVEVTIVQITRVSGTPTYKNANGTNLAIVLNQWSVSGSTITLNELVGIQPGCTYTIVFKVA